MLYWRGMRPFLLGDMVLNLDYEDKEFVIEAMAQLTERQLLAFLLWVMGFTQEESGRIMGIEQCTVSRHLKAALQKMQSYRQYMHKKALRGDV